VCEAGDTGAHGWLTARRGSGGGGGGGGGGGAARRGVARYGVAWRGTTQPQQGEAKRGEARRGEARRGEARFDSAQRGAARPKGSVGKLACLLTRALACGYVRSSPILILLSLSLFLSHSCTLAAASSSRATSYLRLSQGRFIA